jgi:hypothetical protein
MDTYTRAVPYVFTELASLLDSGHEAAVFSDVWVGSERAVFERGEGPVHIRYNAAARVLALASGNELMFVREEEKTQAKACCSVEDGVSMSMHVSFRCC